MSQVIVQGGRGLLQDSPPIDHPLLMDLFAGHSLPLSQQLASQRMLAVAQVQLRRILQCSQVEETITREIRAGIEYASGCDLRLRRGRARCKTCFEAFEQTTCAAGVELLQRRRVCERLIGQQLCSLPEALTLSVETDAFIQVRAICIIALTAFWNWELHCYGSLEQDQTRA